MPNVSDVAMGSGLRQWYDGRAITLTMCVTENCNLACNYCYMVRKGTGRRMDFGTAKDIVDFVLADPYITKGDAVVWDFIGGEPLLEMELIDEICDYIVMKMYTDGHKWFDRYRFSFSTNGVLFGQPRVQSFLMKHRGHAWFTLSVDGTKTKHDAARKKRDGSGSYDDVIRNVPTWLRYFPNASTKATFAHGDLQYLKESVIHLWQLGIKNIMANVVYEDVWQEDDDIIFEQQLRELADYVLENELWKDHSVAFFNPRSGLPVNRNCLDKNRCGAGYKSLGFDCAGNIYPCIRFLEMCFGEKKGLTLGNITDGLDMDRLRPFVALDWKSQSPEECNRCNVGMDCGWCVAYNYELSSSDSIYGRSMALCKMHKANARANKYFWDGFTRRTGRTSPRTLTKASLADSSCLRFMYFITADGITPHCSYENAKEREERMSREVLLDGLDWCRRNAVIPVFLGACDHGLDSSKEYYVEIRDVRDADPKGEFIGIYDNHCEYPTAGAGAAILLVNRRGIEQVYQNVSGLLKHKSRVNLFVQDLFMWEEELFKCYENQLARVCEDLFAGYRSGQTPALNIVTDLWELRWKRDCGAGVASLALAPKGEVYVCPAFYFSDRTNPLGSLADSVDTAEGIRSRVEASPVCSLCDVHNCVRCLHLNKRLTGEIHIPSAAQCRIGHIHRETSRTLQGRLMQEGIVGSPVNVIGELIHGEPFYRLQRKEGLIQCT